MRHSLSVLIARYSSRVLSLLIVLVLTPVGRAEILLRDDFDDASGPLAAQGDGLVDISKFRAPFGGADFTGRTQYRFELPAENVAQTGIGGVGSPTGSTDGKVAVIEFDTYNPLDPGNAFYGTDVISKQPFTVGGGLRMETRMRVDSSTPGGLVSAAFLYEVTRENPPGTQVRDEIDHELISNLAQSGAPHDTFTNQWNDGDFASPGTGAVIGSSGSFSINDFHNYRTDWVDDKVQYYIDDVLVRTEIGDVPDDPMRAHMNFWAPDSSFAMAYDASLTPAATEPAGDTYSMEVDYLQLERFNTTTSANLLADGSFETFPLDPPAADGTGGWSVFNNGFQDGIELLAQDGFFSLKTYGPFTGSPNASGAYQNVPAAPGEEFQGSIWAFAPSSDPIKGNENYTALTLQFVDAGGEVIGSVNFGPGTNQQETPIFDGRDTNMIEDEWVQYTVEGVAPAGTAFARINAFFIQLNNEGGAVWFDNASLNRLTAQTDFALADLDLDGDVDGSDLASWQDSFGANPGADVTGDQATTGGDFLVWQRQFTGPAGAAPAAAGVPEPATLGLAAFAGMALLALRRRST